MKVPRASVPLPAVLVALAGLAVSGCAQGFWDRTPRVAGSRQTPPAAASVAPVPAPQAYAPTAPPTGYGTPEGGYAAPAPSYGAPSAYGAPADHGASEGHGAPAAPGAGVAPYALPVPRPADLPPRGPVAPGPTAEDSAVLAYLNPIRASWGLRPLAWSPVLWRAAYAHSEEQARHGYMGHDSPDPARRTLVQRMQVAGYSGALYGEVVAWGYRDAQAVVEGWMNSREHREILLDRELTEAGFSRVGGYWTGNFGAPRAAPLGYENRPFAPAPPPTAASPLAYAPAPVPAPTYARPPAAALPAAPAPTSSPWVPAPRPAPTHAPAAPAPAPYAAPAPRVQDYFPPAAPMAPPPVPNRPPARGG